MKNMLLADYWMAIGKAVALNPSLRWGQAAFNLLSEEKPDLANQIQGTDKDPFYCYMSDLVIQRFIEFIEEEWEDQVKRSRYLLLVLLVVHTRLLIACVDPTTWNHPVICYGLGVETASDDNGQNSITAYCNNSNGTPVVTHTKG